MVRTNASEVYRSLNSFDSSILEWTLRTTILLFFNSHTVLGLGSSLDGIDLRNSSVLVSFSYGLLVVNFARYLS